MGRRGGARGGPLGHRSRDKRGAATGAGAATATTTGHRGAWRSTASRTAGARDAAGTAPQPLPGGQGGGRFPAQQRPKGDPELIQRGRGLFAGACGPCHGADARGGQLGGPNLLRSELALNDKAGELMYPVIKNGRPGTQMVADGVARPGHPRSHRVRARPAGQDRRPGQSASGLGSGTRHRRRRRQGRRGVFRARCATCHSASGDLKGIATRAGQPKALQNLWVSGGRAIARGGGGRPPGRRTTRRDDGHGDAPVG